jgi:hypothetical protein
LEQEHQSSYSAESIRLQGRESKAGVRYTRAAMESKSWLRGPSNALGISLDLNALRSRLRQMTDAELLAFGRQMRSLVYPLTYDGDGKPSFLWTLVRFFCVRGRAVAVPVIEKVNGRGAPLGEKEVNTSSDSDAPCNHRATETRKTQYSQAQTRTRRALAHTMETRCGLPCDASAARLRDGHNRLFNLFESRPASR